MDSHETVNVYAADERIAIIRLQGRPISSQGPLGPQGKLRPFELVDGNLIQVWDRQTVVELQGNGTGRQRARVAALPAGEGNSGLLELLGLE